jgi:hypothetical protein
MKILNFDGVLLLDYAGENLRCADLTNADLTGADLWCADLQGANLTDASLQGANLTNADLTGANLGGANLPGANLTNANLRGADLRGADLWGANLPCANLPCANLTGADLTGTNLTGANLTGAILPEGQTLPEYIRTLPERLLLQWGETLKEVCAGWETHTWLDCPMSRAFAAKSLGEVPACFRAAAATFIALFDGGHLPKPEGT